MNPGRGSEMTEPKQITFGGGSEGIQIEHIKSRDALRISGWFDHCVGHGDTEISIKEFCDKLGIDLKRVGEVRRIKEGSMKYPKVKVEIRKILHARCPCGFGWADRIMTTKDFWYWHCDKCDSYFRTDKCLPVEVANCKHQLMPDAKLANSWR